MNENMSKAWRRTGYTTLNIGKDPYKTNIFDRGNPYVICGSYAGNMQGSVPGLDAEAAEELFTKECRN
jgi:hypothetical protein